jgi:hypothetical protein
VKGLYTYDKKPSEDPQEWAFITTVKEKQDLYTRWECNAAVCAHRVQNIIMHPGVWEYISIMDNNIVQNLSVTCDNIQATKDIFRLNLGALKGKTVSQQCV